MKNLEIVELYNGLSKIDLRGVKFSYFVARNVSLLKPHIEALQKASEMSKEYQKYESERIKLVKKSAKKDAKGNEIIENDRYVLEDEETFKQEFEELKTKYAEEIEARSKQISEYSKLLEEGEAELELHKINLEDVPGDISTIEMKNIINLIEE